MKLLHWLLDALNVFRGCMVKLDKRILEDQIRVYLEWARKHTNTGVMSFSDTKYLEHFSIHTSKTDIDEVSDEDITKYIETLKEAKMYVHEREHAERALRKLKYWYTARTRNGFKRASPGRPPHLGEIALVQYYRNLKPKPLSFREIESIMGKPKSLLHRWSKYPLYQAIEEASLEDLLRGGMKKLSPSRILQFFKRSL